MTPSLKGRWNPEESQLKDGQYWMVDMPVKIMEYELDEFVNFIYNKMKETENNRVKGVKDIGLRKAKTPEGFEYDIDFGFISGEIVSQPVNTRNTLEVRKKGSYCTVYLKCKPSTGSVGSQTKFQFRETSLFVRSVLLLWGSQSFTVAAPLYDSLDHLISLIEKYRPKEVNLLTSDDKAGETNNLIHLLKEKGVKVPFFHVFLANALNFTECLNKAKPAVKESEIVCITGGTEQMNRALVLEARVEKKKVCCYVGAKDKGFLFVEFRAEEGRVVPD